MHGEQILCNYSYYLMSFYTSLIVPTVQKIADISNIFQLVLLIIVINLFTVHTRLLCQRSIWCTYHTCVKYARYFILWICKQLPICLQMPSHVVMPRIAAFNYSLNIFHFFQRFTSYNLICRMSRCKSFVNLDGEWFSVVIIKHSLHFLA